MGFTYTFVSICGHRFSNWIPRNGSIPLHSVSIVNFTGKCAWLSVSKKLDAVSIFRSTLALSESRRQSLQKGLLRTMLDRTHRLSSSSTHFSDECDRLKTVFSRLKYPKHLVNSTIKSFVDSQVCDQQQPLLPSQEKDDTIRVVLPFKDQISADIVRKQLKDLSLKVHTTIQPVFVSRKFEQELNVKETKQPIVNQQCVVYSFQCNLCDAGYVGYTRGHLHNRVKGHKQQSSAIAKHYKNMHGTMPQGLLERFKVLKKCKNKFDCLVYEMLFIRALKPNLNVQADSIRAKVFL